MTSLGVRVVRLTVLVIAIQAVVLFVAAWDLAYWNGWLFVALQAISMGATNAYLYVRDPRLLDRRLASEEEGEREPVQRRVLVLLRVGAAAMLVVAGIEHRL